MIPFHDVLREILTRLRGSRALPFLPCQSPPAAPSPAQPRPGQHPVPPRPLVPPLMPPASPPPLPMNVPSAELYPRQSATWGLEGGWKPTTSGFETRVFEPPRNPAPPQPATLPFSIFDGLFDD